MGSLFGSFPAVSGTITFSINGGAAQSLTTLASNISGSGVAATDALLFGSRPGVAVGSTVVLRAGTLTTTGNFAGAPPTAGRTRRS